ncbi:MAG TPA: ThuA domain-containing protein [Armatimonadota bacterium]|jgi:hypothetical protein
MKRRELITRAGAVALGAGLASFPLGWAANAKPAKRRLLCFTKSAGFEHSVVHRNGDELSYAEKFMQDFGKKYGFEVTCSKDGRLITADNLAKYDAVYFYTTGDLTTEGTDKQPAMSPEGKAALLDFVRKGKGFLGGHTASDTFHSGSAIDPYIEMIGGEFLTHNAQQEAHMIVADRKFPGVKKLGEGYRLNDEWYAMRNFGKDLHVVLVQETKGMEGPAYQRPSYPATWARMHGKGRVFCCSMGHREDVWTNPIFESVLMGGLSWAFGDVKYRIKPNIQEVCPGYDQVGK